MTYNTIGFWLHVIPFPDEHALIWALGSVRDTDIGTSLFKRCIKGIFPLNINHLQFEKADSMQQIICICQTKT